jgi:hypothetical protein
MLIVQKNQTSLCSWVGGPHLMEKLNGIKYLYASPDRHPNVCPVANFKQSVT